MQSVDSEASSEQKIEALADEPHRKRHKSHAQHPIQDQAKRLPMNVIDRNRARELIVNMPDASESSFLHVCIETMIPMPKLRTMRQNLLKNPLYRSRFKTLR